MVKITILLLIFNLSIGVANEIVDSWMPGQEGTIRPASGVGSDVYRGSTDDRYDVSNVGLTSEGSNVFQFYNRITEGVRSLLSAISSLVRTGKRLEDIIQGVFPGSGIEVPGGVILILDGISTIVIAFGTYEMIRGVSF